MFIDVHSHMFQDRYPCDNLPKNVDQLEEIDLNKFLRELDKNRIKYVVTLAQDMTRPWNGWLGSNALAADLQKKSKGGMIGIAGAEPLDQHDRLNAERLSDFESCVKENGLKGLLLTPPYGHYFVNDRRAYPFYAKAVELNVPVYIHQAAQFFPPANFTPLEYGRVWLLDSIAIDFPTLYINVEHMAFPWTQELLALMAHAPNVYTDISALFGRPTVLAWNLVMAKEYGVIDRVMYGSDYVGNNIPEYITQVMKETEWCRSQLDQIMKRAGWPTLTEKEIVGILLDNAVEFLGLKESFTN